MKRTLAITAIALTAITGAASASVPPAVEAQIQRIAPSADVDALTDAEIAVVMSIIHGGGTESEKRAALKSFVR